MLCELNRKFNIKRKKNWNVEPCPLTQAQAKVHPVPPPLTADEEGDADVDAAIVEDEVSAEAEVDAATRRLHPILKDTQKK